MNGPITFDHGATLIVYRSATVAYDKLGDRLPTELSHTIGPCGLVDSHGNVEIDTDGLAKWVGTVDVEAHPDADIQAGDRVELPNGDRALVITPPERPMNPFTGWRPYCKFTLASPGYVDAQKSD